ncbi:hypothetical protein J8273_5296 [Carpediemonas membranifera]|uniref:Uncharacterized protein n=1 Tax=Carpediemonas membranifera TaxID=201153 RepID=A0A8J6B8N5_9EUKA|nr:hypothetical protein J8273_5296 [Carpediemonas membranifera]|eukprot:KAG9392307.1 hypothetical protein J8273_5296 [Carpediemonas membranifera]
MNTDAVFGGAIDWHTPSDTQHKRDIAKKLLAIEPPNFSKPSTEDQAHKQPEEAANTDTFNVKDIYFDKDNWDSFSNWRSIILDEAARIQKALAEPPVVIETTTASVQADEDEGPVIARSAAVQVDAPIAPAAEPILADATSTEPEPAPLAVLVDAVPLRGPDPAPVPAQVTCIAPKNVPRVIVETMAVSVQADEDEGSALTRSAGVQADAPAAAIPGVGSRVEPESTPVVHVNSSPPRIPEPEPASARDAEPPVREISPEPSPVASPELSPDPEPSALSLPIDPRFADMSIAQVIELLHASPLLAPSPAYEQAEHTAEPALAHESPVAAPEQEHGDETDSETKSEPAPDRHRQAESETEVEAEFEQQCPVDPQSEQGSDDVPLESTARYVGEIMRLARDQVDEADALLPGVASLLDSTDSLEDIIARPLDPEAEDIRRRVEGLLNKFR